MRKLWLPAILILAFLLRFINLTSYPVGFNADEASFGYDAYSILKTGRDQWGNFLPLTLKSFGDYKAPLYGYLAIPFVAIFGLGEFAVRLPNVIIGTLAVYVVYHLTSEISKKIQLTKHFPMPIIASLLLAISPWSVMMSRGAFEANLITLLIPLGIYLFLKERYSYSALIFGLSLFSYHSSKIISPLIFIALIILFKKKIILPVLIYTVFFIALIWTLINGAGARISERSITRGALEEGAKAKIALIENGFNPILAKLRHNKYQVVTSRFVTNYLQYVSPKYLFYQGAGEYYYGMIHGIGVLYIFEGLMLLGLFKLKDNKKILKVIVYLIVWVLISILPPALSTGVGYSGHRAIGMIPALQILTAFGFYGWYLLFQNYNLTIRKITIAIFILISFLNIYKFLNIYFKNIPNESYKQMLYGNLKLSKWLGENYHNKKILISRSISEPQIFLAFANKMDPGLYQKNTQEWIVASWVDQIPEYSLENYIIKSIDWKLDIKNGNTIIVARPDEFPKGVIPNESIDLPDKSPIIYVKYY